MLAGMLELALGRVPPGGDLRLGATEELPEAGTGTPTAPAWAPGLVCGREDTRGEGDLPLERSEPVPPEAVGAPGVTLPQPGPFPAPGAPRARAAGAVPALSPLAARGHSGVAVPRGGLGAAPAAFPMAGAAAGGPGCSCAPGGWRAAPASACLSTWERGPAQRGNLLELPPPPAPASSSACAPAVLWGALPGSPPGPGGLPPPGPGPGTAPPAEAAAAAAAL